MTIRPASSALSPPFRVALVTPFGLRPKGTTIARVLPIAKVLAAQGATVRVIVPPWDDPTRARQTWREDGVEIIHTSLGPPLIKPAVIFSNLVRQIGAFRPHVIHAFKPIGYSGALAWWLLARRSARPHPRTPHPLVVVDADDLEGPGGWAGRRRLGLDGEIRGLQERAVLRRATRVTVASRWLERYVVSLGVPAERVLYLPNGVPGSGFRVPTSVSASELGTQNPQLVWYTRFTEASPQRAASLLAPLLRSRPELRLTVIGDEVDAGNRHELEQALENAEVHRQVDWLAYNPSVLSPNAVAIYPMDDEPVNWARCPAKVPELMALGIAIVAEAVGEISAYLGGFEHECLVPPGDGEALRQRAAALLDDSAARADLGTRLQSASERWRWDKLAGGLLAWYQSSIGNQPAVIGDWASNPES